MKKPNLVFYFSDQQRWDTCGCYGQRLPVTPNLDRLAAEGTLFRSAFTCQPVCGPARSCLQTGLYASETTCIRNGISLPTHLPTIADYFAQAGYETAYVGKWHLASDTGGQDYQTSAIPEQYRGGYRDYWMASDVLEFTSHGYNGYVFDRENRKREFIGYRADCINNYAVDYIRKQTGEKPFFLFISQIEPHHQNDHHVFEGPDGSKERFAEFAVPGDLEGTGGDWRENYPDYLGQCHSLDQNVGRLVDSLKARGMWENTILFYTSDHGCHFRTRNAEYKRSCHDGCTHIPLIVHGPGFYGGNEIDEMVSLIDLPVTLLDCAGLARPPQFQGHSLKALVEGTAPAWPDDVFIQSSESQNGRAIRTKEWKYSVSAGNYTDESWRHARLYHEEFLYDLQKDPHERNNLVADPRYEEVRREMAERLRRRMREVHEEEPQIAACI